MAIEITVPRLGWSMDEGTFVQWLKQDGEEVRAGEPLFSLETEKAVQEVEAVDDGILRLIPHGPQEGDTVSVGQVLGYLLQAGEAMPPPPPAAAPAIPKSQERWQVTPVPAAAAVSPRAARLAQALGINLATVQGSGRGGRVRERDVRAAAASRPAARVAVPQLADRDLPLSSTRRTIAERMLHSRATTAAVTLTTQADATRLVELRTQLKEVGLEVPVPSFTDIVIKLTAMALEAHPQLNARWAGDRIVLCGRIDIGMAVDTEAGLVVPVIRDVPRLRLGELAAISRDLIDRAKSRRLSPEEMSGGTFTVSNLGPMGIDVFTPIINAPECAILGMGQIARRPAVVGEQVAIREQVWLSLTFDHRLVDGAPAARFLDFLRALIENPGVRLIL